MYTLKMKLIRQYKEHIDRLSFIQEGDLNYPIAKDMVDTFKILMAERMMKIIDIMENDTTKLIE